MTGNIQGNAAGTDSAAYSGTLPNFSGDVQYAVLDLNIGCHSNEFAGVNEMVADSHILFKKSGALYSYKTAIFVPTHHFYHSVADVRPGHIIYGTYDISSAPVEPGMTYAWKWQAPQTTHDTIDFREVQPLLRLYLR